MTVRIFTFSLSLLLVFTFSPAAQETSRPLPSTDDDAIKISTSLIQIDATVTDKNGRIVRNLKPEDFQIFENGKKRDLTNFSFIELGAAPQSKTPTPQQALKPVPGYVPLPQIPKPPTQSSRVYALVIDDLSMSFDGIVYTRIALEKFIKDQMQDGDLVALVRTAGGAGQNFTTNKELLLRQISKLRWNANGANFESIETIKPTTIEAVRGNSDSIVEQAGKEREFQERVADLRSRSFAVGTLGSLDFITRSMAGLPGRKALLMFSEGFSINTRNGSDLSAQNELFEYLRLISDTANRSSVVIYTLDPRGLDNPEMLMAKDELDTSFRPGGGGPKSLSRELRAQRFNSSQDTLRFLAEQTGGTAYVNQNKLEIGVGKALDDQSGYYLLGYQPEEESFDPKKARFNDLKVRLRDKSLRVRYRSGFFGVADIKPSTTSEPKERALFEALKSPFNSADIGLNLYPLFSNSAKDGDTIHALLYINIRDLDFKLLDNGNRHSVFDVMTLTYGVNGKVVSRVWKSYTLDLPKELYERALSNGFVYDFYIPNVKPGANQMRIVLRDETTGRIGSASQFVEIPNISKQRVTMSTLVLDNFSAADWERMRRGDAIRPSGSSAFVDSTLRRFKRGSVLGYGYEIYTPASKETSNLQMTTRLIRDNKIVIESEPTPVDTANRPDSQRIPTSGVMTLGTELPAGSYVLQIIVTEGGGKSKRDIATQWVDFELTD